MASSIVKKAENKILNPDKRTTVIEGVTYKIKPLSDAAFQDLSDVIGHVVSVLGLVQEVFKDGIDGAPLAQLASAVPGLFSVLIPASSKIIAQSLKPLEGDTVVDHEWVQENVYANDRIRLVGEILEANGVAEILGELTRTAKKILPERVAPSPDLTPTPPLPGSTPVTSPTP